MTPFTSACKTDASCIHIGLVNNMPDSALEATERQFRALLSEAAGGITTHLSLFALPELPRSEGTRKRMDSSYSNISALWDNRLDGLIVTGAEPVSRNLIEEPYWETLIRLIEWAEHNTYSSVWSCLAAHAAVLRLDGIQRRRLSDKLCGVFEVSNRCGHALTDGVPSHFSTPHSRWNDISPKALTACGYRLLTQLEDGSPDAFVKARKSLFVFFQGHPEYDARSLLLEYRRDIRRFLNDERDTYPSMPCGYFNKEDAAVFASLQAQTAADSRQHSFQNFPTSIRDVTVRSPWRPQAVTLYRNWLSYLSEQKNERLRNRQRQVDYQDENVAAS